MGESQSILERLSSRDNVTRIITLCVLLSFIIPYLNPIGLPIVITNYTQECYDLIMDLGPGDIILIDQNWGGYGERTPGTIAIFRQLFEEMEDVRMVILSCDAPGLSQLATHSLLTKILDIPDTKVYGTDYVYLGFVPGWEPMIAALAQDPTSVYPTDYYGAPTADMPIFQDVEYKNTGRRGFVNYEDIDLIFNDEGKHTTRYFIYQWGDPFGIPMITLASMKDITEYVMYYPHSVQGLLMGSRGGAEYEMIIEKPGLGLASMDAMSAVSMVAITFLIIGNISYLYKKQRGQSDVWFRKEVWDDQTYEREHGIEGEET
jgi:hypothetical protein